MKYIGEKIYRPWTEADSLLIQVTLGCANNNCTFCNMYKHTSFRVRKLEDVFEQIEEARKLHRYVESIFLIDGDVMVVKSSHLLKIVNKIKETFPEIKNIALYAEFRDFKRKTVEELIELRKAGLTKAYVGLESGDPVTLERIKKGMTREDAIEGMQKAKKAGIKVLVSTIFGLGGKERSKEHAIATTSLLNILQPDEIAPMALTIQPGTELEDEFKAGKFTLPTPLQILEEEKYMLENMDNFKIYYWGNHGNNIAPMKGWFPQYKQEFLDVINKNINNNPITKQEVLKTFAW